MSAQHVPAPLREFLEDLSAIREQKQVALEEIRAATKVNLHIIAQFEQDGLLDHPLFNDLYIRAFVRGYAKALEILPDELAGLYEKAVSGTYRRELAVKYLGLAYEIEPPDEPVAEEKEEETRVPSQASAQEPSPPHSRITWVAAAATSNESNFVSSAKGILASILSRESAFVQWGIVAIGGGIGLLLILQLLSLQRTGEESSGSVLEETPPPPSPVVDQTIPGDTSMEMTVSPEKPFELRDSLDLYVVAATGKLDPFRVRVDEDWRRPYWLDVGDSMRFRMAQQIVLEDNLDAMRILLEGHVYPILDTDSTASVVITRDTARAFLAVRN